MIPPRPSQSRTSAIKANIASVENLMKQDARLIMTKLVDSIGIYHRVLNTVLSEKVNFLIDFPALLDGGTKGNPCIMSNVFLTSTKIVTIVVYGCLLVMQPMCIILRSKLQRPSSVNAKRIKRARKKLYAIFFKFKIQIDEQLLVDFIRTICYQRFVKKERGSVPQRPYNVPSRFIYRTCDFSLFPSQM